MKKQAFVLIFVGLATAAAQAGVMSPGRWEVKTTIVSSTGPKARQLPKEPTVLASCLKQTFVDKDNYTSPEFSMERMKRNDFECKVDSKSGDTKSMKWQTTCKRKDGFEVVSTMQSEVSAETLVQSGKEVTKQNGELWSEVVAKVEGKRLKEACKLEDITPE
jgi:hypothetical protein